MTDDLITATAYKTLHWSSTLAPSGHYRGFGMIGFLYYLSFLAIFQYIIFGGDLK